MRELKFRIGCISGNVFRYLDKDELFNLYRLNPYDGSLIAKDNGRNVVVPRKAYVIEQYTGLKDKNGKKMYEGDIVRYGRRLRGIVPPESHTEIVSWRSGEEEYYPCCTTSGFSLPYSEDGYEVIGNVHENPELLEIKNEI